MTQEVTIRINGASVAILHTDNNAEVGGMTGDVYDIRSNSVQRVQDAHIGVPSAPNAYYDAYMGVDYMGYANPTYRIRGTFDEMAAEQLLQSNAASGQKDVSVADGKKFTTSQDVYIWDDSNYELNTIASISGNTLTMTTNLTAPGYTTANGARVRTRDVVGRRVLQYFLEEDENKVLIDPILVPDGICVQIQNISITKAVESISPSEGQPEVIQSLGANANSGQPDVTVTDGAAFSVSEIVHVWDNNNLEECIISSILGNVLTMTANLSKSYTIARNAKIAAGESVKQGAIMDYEMQVVETPDGVV